MRETLKLLLNSTYRTYFKRLNIFLMFMCINPLRAQFCYV
jgi:hypothetical protein